MASTRASLRDGLLTNGLSVRDQLTRDMKLRDEGTVTTSAIHCKQARALCSEDTCPKSKLVVKGKTEQLEQNLYDALLQLQGRIARRLCCGHGMAVRPPYTSPHIASIIVEVMQWTVWSNISAKYAEEVAVCRALFDQALLET